MKMDYIDISPTISETTAVFPGDRAFSRQLNLDFKTGGNLQLSSIEGTVHLGAHVDAPCHYHPKGESIDSRSLDYYLGDCQVIEVKILAGTRITENDIAFIDISAPRILFKTGSFPNPNKWNSDFNSLSPQLIKYLHQKRVKLVGIDTPSIDPFDDKKLESHHEIFENNMAVLEGVVLNHVAPGPYTLVALPLKIKEGDASPVRAILLKGRMNLV